MAKKKEAGAAKKKAVKSAGSVRVRSVRDIDRFFSSKETPPIDVHDEYGMITEGIHPPFQYKNPKTVDAEGKVRQVGRFEKTAKDRADWGTGVISNLRHKKGPTGGSSSGNKKEIRHMLIIHLKNVKGSSTFTTTRSFNVYPSEVKVIVGKYPVTVYHYRGNKVYVK